MHTKLDGNHVGITPLAPKPITAGYRSYDKQLASEMCVDNIRFLSDRELLYFLRRCTSWSWEIEHPSYTIRPVIESLHERLRSYASKKGLLFDIEVRVIDQSLFHKTLPPLQPGQTHHNRELRLPETEELQVVKIPEILDDTILDSLEEIELVVNILRFIEMTIDLFGISHEEFDYYDLLEREDHMIEKSALTSISELDGSVPIDPTTGSRITQDNPHGPIVLRDLDGQNVHTKYYSGLNVFAALLGDDDMEIVQNVLTVLQNVISTEQMAGLEKHTQIYHRLQVLVSSLPQRAPLSEHVRLCPTFAKDEISLVNSLSARSQNYNPYSDIRKFCCPPMLADNVKITIHGDVNITHTSERVPLPKGQAYAIPMDQSLKHMFSYAKPQEDRSYMENYPAPIFSELLAGAMTLSFGSIWECLIPMLSSLQCLTPEQYIVYQQTQTLPEQQEGCEIGSIHYHLFEEGKKTKKRDARYGTSPIPLPHWRQDMPWSKYGYIDVDGNVVELTTYRVAVMVAHVLSIPTSYVFCLSHFIRESFRSWSPAARCEQLQIQLGCVLAMYQFPATRSQMLSYLSHDNSKDPVNLSARQLHFVQQPQSSGESMLKLWNIQYPKQVIPTTASSSYTQNIVFMPMALRCHIVMTLIGLCSHEETADEQKQLGMLQNGLQLQLLDEGITMLKKCSKTSFPTNPCTCHHPNQRLKPVTQIDHEFVPENQCPIPNVYDRIHTLCVQNPTEVNIYPNYYTLRSTDIFPSLIEKDIPYGYASISTSEAFDLHEKTRSCVHVRGRGQCYCECSECSKLDHILYDSSNTTLPPAFVSTSWCQDAHHVFPLTAAESEASSYVFLMLKWVEITLERYKGAAIDFVPVLLRIIGATGEAQTSENSKRSEELLSAMMKGQNDAALLILEEDAASEENKEEETDSDVTTIAPIEESIRCASVFASAVQLLNTLIHESNACLRQFHQLKGADITLLRLAQILDIRKNENQPDTTPIGVGDFCVSNHMYSHGAFVTFSTTTIMSSVPPLHLHFPQYESVWTSLENGILDKYSKLTGKSKPELPELTIYTSTSDSMVCPYKDIYMQQIDDLSALPVRGGSSVPHGTFSGPGYEWQLSIGDLLLLLDSFYTRSTQTIRSDVQNSGLLQAAIIHIMENTLVPGLVENNRDGGSALYKTASPSIGSTFMSKENEYMKLKRMCNNSSGQENTLSIPDDSVPDASSANNTGSSVFEDLSTVSLFDNMSSSIMQEIYPTNTPKVSHNSIMLPMDKFRATCAVEYLTSLEEWNGTSLDMNLSIFDYKEEPSETMTDEVKPKKLTLAQSYAMTTRWFTSESHCSCYSVIIAAINNNPSGIRSFIDTKVFETFMRVANPKLQSYDSVLVSMPSVLRVFCLLRPVIEQVNKSDVFHSMFAAFLSSQDYPRALCSDAPALYLSNKRITSFSSSICDLLTHYPSVWAEGLFPAMISSAEALIKQGIVLHKVGLQRSSGLGSKNVYKWTPLSDTMMDVMSTHKATSHLSTTQANQLVPSLLKFLEIHECASTPRGSLPEDDAIPAMCVNDSDFIAQVHSFSMRVRALHTLWTKVVGASPLTKEDHKAIHINGRGTVFFVLYNLLVLWISSPILRGLLPATVLSVTHPIHRLLGLPVIPVKHLKQSSLHSFDLRHALDVSDEVITRQNTEPTIRTGHTHQEDDVMTLLEVQSGKSKQTDVPPCLLRSLEVSDVSIFLTVPSIVLKITTMKHLMVNLKSLFQTDRWKSEAYLQLPSKWVEQVKNFDVAEIHHLIETTSRTSYFEGFVSSSVPPSCSRIIVDDTQRSINNLTQEYYLLLQDIALLNSLYTSIKCIAENFRSSTDATILADLLLCVEPLVILQQRVMWANAIIHAQVINLRCVFVAYNQKRMASYTRFPKTHCSFPSHMREKSFAFTLDQSFINYMMEFLHTLQSIQVTLSYFTSAVSKLTSALTNDLRMNQVEGNVQPIWSPVIPWAYTMRLAAVTPFYTPMSNVLTQAFQWSLHRGMEPDVLGYVRVSGNDKHPHRAFKLSSSSHVSPNIADYTDAYIMDAPGACPSTRHGCILPDGRIDMLFDENSSELASAIQCKVDLGGLNMLVTLSYLRSALQLVQTELPLSGAAANELLSNNTTSTGIIRNVTALYTTSQDPLGMFNMQGGIERVFAIFRWQSLSRARLQSERVHCEALTKEYFIKTDPEKYKLQISQGVVSLATISIEAIIAAGAADFLLPISVNKINPQLLWPYNASASPLTSILVYCHTAKIDLSIYIGHVQNLLDSCIEVIVKFCEDMAMLDNAVLARTSIGLYEVANPEPKSHLNSMVIPSIVAPPYMHFAPALAPQLTTRKVDRGSEVNVIGSYSCHPSYDRNVWFSPTCSVVGLHLLFNFIGSDVCTLNVQSELRTRAKICASTFVLPEHLKDSVFCLVTRQDQWVPLVGKIRDLHPSSIGSILKLFRSIKGLRSVQCKGIDLLHPMPVSHIGGKKAQDKQLLSTLEPGSHNNEISTSPTVASSKVIGALVTTVDSTQASFDHRALWLREAVCPSRSPYSIYTVFSIIYDAVFVRTDARQQAFDKHILQKRKDQQMQLLSQMGDDQTNAYKTLLSQEKYQYIPVLLPPTAPPLSLSNASLPSSWKDNDQMHTHNALPSELAFYTYIDEITKRYNTLNSIPAPACAPTGLCSVYSNCRSIFDNWSQLIFPTIAAVTNTDVSMPLYTRHLAPSPVVPNMLDITPTAGKPLTIMTLPPDMYSSESCALWSTPLRKSNHPFGSNVVFAQETQKSLTSLIATHLDTESQVLPSRWVAMHGSDWEFLPFKQGAIGHKEALTRLYDHMFSLWIAALPNQPKNNQFTYPKEGVVGEQLDCSFASEEEAILYALELLQTYIQSHTACMLLCAFLSSSSELRILSMRGDFLVVDKNYTPHILQYVLPHVTALANALAVLQPICAPSSIILPGASPEYLRTAGLVDISTDPLVTTASTATIPHFGCYMPAVKARMLWVHGQAYMATLQCILVSLATHTRSYTSFHSSLAVAVLDASELAKTRCKDSKYFHCSVEDNTPSVTVELDIPVKELTEKTLSSMHPKKQKDRELVVDFGRKTYQKYRNVLGALDLPGKKRKMFKVRPSTIQAAREKRYKNKQAPHSGMTSPVNQTSTKKCTSIRVPQGTKFSWQKGLPKPLACILSDMIWKAPLCLAEECELILSVCQDLQSKPVTCALPFVLETIARVCRNPALARKFVRDPNGFEKLLNFPVTTSLARTPGILSSASSPIGVFGNQVENPLLRHVGPYGKNFRGHSHGMNAVESSNLAIWSNIDRGLSLEMKEAFYNVVSSIVNDPHEAVAHAEIAILGAFLAPFTKDNKINLAQHLTVVANSQPRKHEDHHDITKFSNYCEIDALPFPEKTAPLPTVTVDLDAFFSLFGYHKLFHSYLPIFFKALTNVLSFRNNGTYQESVRHNCSHNNAHINPCIPGLSIRGLSVTVRPRPRALYNFLQYLDSSSNIENRADIEKDLQKLYPHTSNDSVNDNPFLLMPGKKGKNICTDDQKLLFDSILHESPAGPDVFDTETSESCGVDPSLYTPVDSTNQPAWTEFVPAPFVGSLAVDMMMRHLVADAGWNNFVLAKHMEAQIALSLGQSILPNTEWKADKNRTANSLTSAPAGVITLPLHMKPVHDKMTTILPLDVAAPPLIDYGIIAWVLTSLLPSFPSYIHQMLAFNPHNVVVNANLSGEKHQPGKNILLKPAFGLYDIATLLLKLCTQDHSNILAPTQHCSYLLVTMSGMGVPKVDPYLLSKIPSLEEANATHLKLPVHKPMYPPALPMFIKRWAQSVISICYSGWSLQSLFIPCDAKTPPTTAFSEQNNHTVMPLPNCLRSPTGDLIVPETTADILLALQQLQMSCFYRSSMDPCSPLVLLSKKHHSDQVIVTPLQSSALTCARMNLGVDDNVVTPQEVVRAGLAVGSLIALLESLQSILAKTKGKGSLRHFSRDIGELMVVNGGIFALCVVLYTVTNVSVCKIALSILEKILLSNSQKPLKLHKNGEEPNNIIDSDSDSDGDDDDEDMMDEDEELEDALNSMEDMDDGMLQSLLASAFEGDEMEDFDMSNLTSDEMRDAMPVEMEFLDADDDGDGDGNQEDELMNILQRNDTNEREDVHPDDTAEDIMERKMNTRNEDEFYATISDEDGSEQDDNGDYGDLMGDSYFSSDSEDDDGGHSDRDDDNSDRDDENSEPEDDDFAFDIPQYDLDDLDESMVLENHAHNANNEVNIIDIGEVNVDEGEFDNVIQRLAEIWHRRQGSGEQPDFSNNRDAQNLLNILQTNNAAHGGGIPTQGLAGIPTSTSTGGARPSEYQYTDTAIYNGLIYGSSIVVSNTQLHFVHPITHLEERVSLEPHMDIVMSYIHKRNRDNDDSLMMQIVCKAAEMNNPSAFKAKAGKEAYLHPVTILCEEYVRNSIPYFMKRTLSKDRCHLNIQKWCQVLLKHNHRVIPSTIQASQTCPDPFATLLKENIKKTVYSNTDLLPWFPLFDISSANPKVSSEINIFNERPEQKESPVDESIMFKLPINSTPVEIVKYTYAPFLESLSWIFTCSYSHETNQLTWQPYIRRCGCTCEYLLFTPSHALPAHTSSQDVNKMFPSQTAGPGNQLICNQFTPPTPFCSLSPLDSKVLDDFLYEQSNQDGLSLPPFRIASYTTPGIGDGRGGFVHAAHKDTNSNFYSMLDGSSIEAYLPLEASVSNLNAKIPLHTRKVPAGLALTKNGPLNRNVSRALLKFNEWVDIAQVKCNIVKSIRDKGMNTSNRGNDAYMQALKKLQAPKQNTKKKGLDFQSFFGKNREMQDGEFGEMDEDDLDDVLGELDEDEDMIDALEGEDGMEWDVNDYYLPEDFEFDENGETVGMHQSSTPLRIHSIHEFLSPSIGRRNSDVSSVNGDCTVCQNHPCTCIHNLALNPVEHTPGARNMMLTPLSSGQLPRRPLLLDDLSPQLSNMDNLSDTGLDGSDIDDLPPLPELSPIINRTQQNTQANRNSAFNPDIYGPAFGDDISSASLNNLDISTQLEILGLNNTFVPPASPLIVPKALSSANDSQFSSVCQTLPSSQRAAMLNKLTDEQVYELPSNLMAEAVLLRHGGVIAKTRIEFGLPPIITQTGLGCVNHQPPTVNLEDTVVEHVGKELAHLTEGMSKKHNKKIVVQDGQSPIAAALLPCILAPVFGTKGLQSKKVANILSHLSAYDSVRETFVLLLERLCAEGLSDASLESVQLHALSTNADPSTPDHHQAMANLQRNRQIVEVGLTLQPRSLVPNLPQFNPPGTRTVDFPDYYQMMYYPQAMSVDPGSEVVTVSPILPLRSNYIPSVLSRLTSTVISAGLTSVGVVLNTASGRPGPAQARFKPAHVHLPKQSSVEPLARTLEIAGDILATSPTGFSSMLFLPQPHFPTGVQQNILSHVNILPLSSPKTKRRRQEGTGTNNNTPNVTAMPGFTHMAPLLLDNKTPKKAKRDRIIVPQKEVEENLSFLYQHEGKVVVYWYSPIAVILSLLDNASSKLLSAAARFARTALVHYHSDCLTEAQTFNMATNPVFQNMHTTCPAIVSLPSSVTANIIKAITKVHTQDFKTSSLVAALVLVLTATPAMSPKAVVQSVLSICDEKMDTNKQALPSTLALLRASENNTSITYNANNMLVQSPVYALKFTNGMPVNSLISIRSHMVEIQAKAIILLCQAVETDLSSTYMDKSFLVSLHSSLVKNKGAIQAAPISGIHKLVNPTNTATTPLTVYLRQVTQLVYIKLLKQLDIIPDLYSVDGKLDHENASNIQDDSKMRLVIQANRDTLKKSGLRNSLLGVFAALDIYLLSLQPTVARTLVIARQQRREQVEGLGQQHQGQMEELEDSIVMKPLPLPSFVTPVKKLGISLSRVESSRSMNTNSSSSSSSSSTSNNNNNNNSSSAPSTPNQTITNHNHHAHSDGEAHTGQLSHLPILETYFLIHAPAEPPARSSFLSLTSRHGVYNEMNYNSLCSVCGEYCGRKCTEISDNSPTLEEFYKFVSRHQRVLGFLCKKVPKLLQGPHGKSTFPLALTGKGTGRQNSLLWHPLHILDFSIRLKFFKGCIRQAHLRRPTGKLTMCLRREYVFTDTFHQWKLFSTADLRRAMDVKFVGEDGVDAGGLTKEFFLVVSRTLFDANYGLFEPTVDNPGVFVPSRISSWHADFIDLFRFSGRFVAKAMFEGERVDCYFSKTLFKHLLGIELTLEDMASIDNNMHTSLRMTLQHRLADMLLDDLTFSTEYDDCGNRIVQELVPNGKNIAVTEENKHEYVWHQVDFLLTRSVEPQLRAFIDGFHEIIPRELVGIFTPAELELVLCGLPDIDVTDLRAHTVYTGYGNSPQTHPQILMFWEVVFELDNEDLARLLLFTTGTSKVPVTGFKGFANAFTIQKVVDVDVLPRAHTCFNQLDLPTYTSKDVMREKILIALREGSLGFGIA